VPKLCQQCQKPFGGKRPQAVYCSIRCRNDAAIEKRRQLMKHKRKALVNAEGKYRFCCDGPNCDTTFSSTRNDAIYCSSKCRQASYRQFKMDMGR
jgi:hypothetical protein